eukprot:TRINITY_DN5990_c1_g1_i1.p1 TRINITY_DN5990_c1_g1~~TRINITY_DN5990_c1_g1_i1.p1  ORF type:complete len:63 (-),score=9.15 TRINITY_DN5990_c1_g1_i1:76-264(-)
MFFESKTLPRCFSKIFCCGSAHFFINANAKIRRHAMQRFRVSSFESTISRPCGKHNSQTTAP